MRSREFIKENQLELGQVKVIPDMRSFGVPGLPIGPTNYYHKYRLGVYMAGSPENAFDYDPDGQMADDMVIVGYSSADREILDRALTKFGWKTNQITPKGSDEPDDTHKISPVSNWNKRR